MKKRILSLVLAFLTVISLLPFHTLAEQAEACPYCDYTLAEDGTVIHSDYCNAEYAYDGSGDVGKYVRLSDFSVEYNIMVSGDPETDDGGFLYYEEFVEGTVMRINNWYWDPGTAALWYQVEIYVGGIVEEAQEYWPETPWVLQNYTENWVEEENALTFVSVCDICGGVECRQTHLYCLACEKFGCELTHQFCGYCNDYDCGIDHLGQNRPAEAPVIPEDPTLTEGADVSVADEYGNAVTDSFILGAGMKSSLSAWTDLEGELSYQWQICVEDQWIDIQGQTAQGILVFPAMLASVAENNAAVIRCEVTGGDTVQTSAEITVNMMDEPAAAFAMGSGGGSQTGDDPELQKVDLIVEYKFGDDTIAANPWTAELTPGKPINEKIKLPVISGYLPTFMDTANAALVLEEGVYYLQLNYADGISEDTPLLVTYQPTNVKVTVLHYLQNESNDNYGEPIVTTRQLLTGSTVGDVQESYPGFYNLLYEKPVVAADGSTVVEVYYDRYYYLMKFELSGGFGVDPIYARYGAAVTVEDPTRPGYVFNGWDKTIPATVPAENTTYTAQWQADPNGAVYTVVYWAENPNDDEYSYWGAQSFIAPVDAIRNGVAYGSFADTVATDENGDALQDIQNIASEIQYFTFDHADQNVTVEGDNSAVINVYYSRNEYSLRFYYARYYGVSYQVSTNTNNFSTSGNIWEGSWGNVGALPTLNDQYESAYNTNNALSGSLDYEGSTYYYIEITAKYNADLSKKWPAAWVNDTSDGKKCVSWATQSGSGYYNNNTNKNIKGTYQRLDNQLIIDPALTADKGLNHVFVAYWSEKPTTYQYNIYIDLLPGETADVTYNGVEYKLLKTDTLLSTDGVSGQTAIPVEGAEKVAGPVDAQQGSGETDFPKEVNFYYKRNLRYLKFYNYNTYLQSGNGAEVLFGKSLSTYGQYVSDEYMKNHYPTDLEPDAYEFKGWYTTAGCYPGSEMDWDITMPDRDMTVYAKWSPKIHHVTVYLTEVDTTTIHEYLIPHGELVAEEDRPPDPINGDLEFIGWFYRDENGTEQAFDFNNMPVKASMHLYAKWSSNVLKEYTIYFVLDENKNGVRDANENTYVADPITGSALAGNSRTFEAKGDTDLYVDYRDGYYPNAVSHTITVNIDDPDNQGANTYTFLYTQEPPIPYKVKYLILGTETPVPGTTEKTVADNTKAVVTENFVSVSGYMPDEYQKTLVVTPGGDNTLIFWYTKDEQHALYQINHYIQNVDGATWTLHDSETITGEIGIAYSASPTTITGFSFNAGTTDDYNVTQNKNGYTGEVLPGAVGAYTGGKVTGTLTSNGMQLNLYYTRNEYPYQIYFLEYGSNRELKDTFNGSAAYGALVSHTAESVITKTDEGIEFELYDTEPETKTMTIMVDKLTGGTVTYNKIVFYYKRCTQDLTISKVVTGEGANPDQAFSFTVTIDPKYSFHQDSYAYGEGKYLSPVDGVLSFSLKNGESITLQDLPTAEYTITEVNLPLGYYADMNATTPGEQPSVDVVLTRDTNVAVTCTNTYDPAVLEITKKVDVVEDNENTPEVENFAFTIKVPAGVTGSYDYTVEGVKHTETVTDGKLTFTLKNGQTARFENVPVGNYTVEEEDYSARGYKSSFVVNSVEKGEGHSVDVQVDRSETRTVECINHFPVGHLQIQKTVTKEFFGTEWNGHTFTFTVERTTADRPLIDGNKYDVYEGETKVDTATVTGNKLQVEIKFTAEDAAKLDEKSERDAVVVRTIEIRNLPAGTYKVTENADDDYVQTPASRVVDGLEIPAETDPVAQFANKLIRPKGDLSLSKELVAADGYTGELPQDTEFSFTFEATLLPPPNGEYKVEYKDKNGNAVPSTPTTVKMEDGKFTIKIKAGQTVTIKNLPIDTYRITEATVPRMANAFYHNGSADPAEIEKDSAGNLCTQIPVPAGETAAVRCVNTYPVDNADLTIIHENAEPGQIFVYEVKNTTNEIITVTVTAGNDGNGSTTIVDLPFGSYTVTQKNDWSWRYREEASDDVKEVVHSSGDTTVTFAQTWIDYWLGGCSKLFKNIFGGG